MHYAYNQKAPGICIFTEKKEFSCFLFVKANKTIPTIYFHDKHQKCFSWIKYFKPFWKTTQKCHVWTKTNLKKNLAWGWDRTHDLWITRFTVISIAPKCFLLKYLFYINPKRHQAHVLPEEMRPKALTRVKQ